MQGKADAVPVTIRGMPVKQQPVFELPCWVNWIAQDSSGSWWGYSVEPLRNDTGWYENEAGRCVRLGHSLPDHWESSLVRTGAGR